jgi:hypothetical protein
MAPCFIDLIITSLFRGVYSIVFSIRKAPVASKRMAGAEEVIEDDASTRYNESNVPLTCPMALRDNETR